MRTNLNLNLNFIAGGAKGLRYRSREQGTEAREFYTTIKTPYTQA